MLCRIILLVRLFRNIFRFWGRLCRLFAVGNALLLQCHLKAQDKSMNFQLKTQLKVDPGSSPGSESSRRRYRLAMAVSDFDNNHDFPRACREYLGHRDAPGRPMSPTADAQCNRWSPPGTSPLSRSADRTSGWCPSRRLAPCRPAGRTPPSAATPSVGRVAAALSDYSNQRSARDSRGPGCDRCSCPARARPILEESVKVSLDEPIMPLRRQHSPATFLVSTMVFKSANSVMCFDMSVDNTISITILRNVWRCFLQWHRDERGERKAINHETLARLPRLLAYFWRFWKISHSSFCNNLKATAKWWFSSTDSSLYIIASSEPEEMERRENAIDHIGAQSTRSGRNAYSNW